MPVRPSQLSRSGIHPPSDLAAAAVATLRRSRLFVQVLRRVLIELLFARGAAEVIRLSSVLSVPSGVSRLNVHTANGIFHNGSAAHMHLLGL
jgi:hypothetical protein